MAYARDSKIDSKLDSKDEPRLLASIKEYKTQQEDLKQKLSASEAKIKAWDQENPDFQRISGKIQANKKIIAKKTKENRGLAIDEKYYRTKDRSKWGFLGASDYDREMGANDVAIRHAETENTEYKNALDKLDLSDRQRLERACASHSRALDAVNSELQKLETDLKNLQIEQRLFANYEKYDLNKVDELLKGYRNNLVEKIDKDLKKKPSLYEEMQKSAEGKFGKDIVGFLSENFAAAGSHPMRANYERFKKDIEPETQKAFEKVLILDSLRACFIKSNDMSAADRIKEFKTILDEPYNEKSGKKKDFLLSSRTFLGNFKPNPAHKTAFESIDKIIQKASLELKLDSKASAPSNKS